jgi:hypothetical protein
VSSKWGGSIAVPASVLVLALIAGGCGGGGDSTTQTAQDKVVFLEKADAICAQGNKELEKANDEAFGDEPGSAAKVEKFVQAELVPKVQAQVNKIRALDVPAGDEKVVEEMLDVAQSDIDRAKSEPNLLVQNQPLFEDANALASEYGLTECGSTHFF